MGSMAPKSTLTVNIEDIKALEFHCQCGASVSIPVRENLSPIVRCASCGQHILEADIPNGKNVAVHKIMSGLAAWKDKTEPKPSITFTLSL